jgi:UTP--glucose-1-phosphate uridylyltransferase
MLPIIDKPVIQYLVEEAVNSGIRDVLFITGRNKRAIEDHFDFSPELESALIAKGKTEALKEVRAISRLATFTYVRQNIPLGDGDAILCGKHLLNGQEAVAVLFGDDIIDSKKPCLAQLLEVYKKYGQTVVALNEVPKSEVHRYGIVKFKKITDRIYQITDIVEKPDPKDAPSNMAIAGKYIITPEVFEHLQVLKDQNKGEEIVLANALKRMLKEKPIYGLRFEGKKYDCGSKIGFLKATVDFALKHKELSKEFKKYLKNISK